MTWHSLHPDRPHERPGAPAWDPRGETAGGLRQWNWWRPAATQLDAPSTTASALDAAALSSDED